MAKYLKENFIENKSICKYNGKIMINHVKEIQLKPVKSTITLALPIIILLFLSSLYSVIDIYWIGGIGTSAVICMGYIANFVYTINKLGDGIGRSVNVLISNSFGAQEIEKTEKYEVGDFAINQV